MRKTLRLLLILCISFQINTKTSAQCSSCTYTATTSGGNFSLNGNETLCITANVSNLNINMNGTGNVICVASGVTWIQDFLTLQGGVTVNVYGTLDNSQQSWSGVSVNGGTACTIDVKAGGTMKTISGGFGNNLTLNNSGTLNFTTTNTISVVGSFILNNTATGVVNAMSTPKFEIGNSATVHNYGTINFANCENAEGYLYVHNGSFLKVSREFNNHGAFIIEPTGDFQLPCETLSGAAGATVCSFRVGDKGAGKEFIANACVKVMNGNVTFDGAGTLNAGFEIGAGYNLIINKPVTGTNGSFLVKGGTSTINVSGNFIGTNMKFYDVNTSGNDFDSKFGNDPTNYTVSSSAGCNIVPTCTSPTITNVAADTATCNASIANSNAALHVTGISGMAKYAYGTNGTTGLFAANATASTASSIDVTGLAVPSVSTTYTFRIWASDTTCYNDTTVVLNPSACACSQIVMSPIPLPAGQIGVPYSIQIVATGGTSPYHYIWRAGTTGTLPDGLSISTSGLVSGTPTTSGSYEVKILVEDNNACSDSLDPAILTIIPCGDTFRICAGQTLTLTAATGTTNIQWKKDGNDLVGETNLSLLVSTVGVYTFTGNDANGCAGGLCCPIVVLDSTCCIVPTITSTVADTATCTNGVTNNDAKIAVRGITQMTKYVYGTNGTTDLYYANATASTADSIKLTNLTAPSVATTYTFRIYGIDSTCYNDTTVVLNPSVCPPCSIVATFTQNVCNNNSTTAIATDDYFTVTVSAVSATNGGTSGKYEVLLNGTVLNAGGTTYGTSVTVGTATTFKSDGTTTYQLKVRDLDIPTCETNIFTTSASAACSIIPCKPQICLPVTVTRVN